MLKSQLMFKALTRIKVLGIAAVVGALIGAPASAAPKKPVGTLVVVGDSLSAGFQNFSLYDTAQNAGFANLIAQQAGVGLVQPLISQPGLPPMLMLGPGGSILRSSGFGARENPAVQSYNLSVPGFTLANVLEYTVNRGQVIAAGPAANPIDAMALSVLAEPGNPPCAVIGADPQTDDVYLSQVACAVQLKPQTIIVSAGNNDALQALTFGAPPTPVPTFAAELATLLGMLRFTGAKIVIGNIPDVSALPFLVPVPVFDKLCGASKEPLGATQADYIVPNIVGPSPNVTLCAAPALRTAALIAQTRTAIVQYNAVIKQVAGEFGVAVADVNGLFAGIAAHDYKVGPDTLTTGFLGGLFSLDAIHPTNTGYAILANQYIDAMNSGLSTNINKVNVRQIEKDDPLVFGKK